MPGRPARPAPSNPGQSGLFVVEGDEGGQPRTGRRQTLRHERNLNTALRETGLDKHPRLMGAITLARAIAAQLDRAERTGDAYATSQLARPFREVLEDLGLLDALGAGGGDDDQLSGLGEATVGDPTE